jgi:hypothetical protein
MPIYGYARGSSSSPAAGSTGNESTPHSTNQVFTVFGEVAGDQWAYRWNAHMGKHGSATPTVQGGVQLAESGNPDEIVVLTDEFAVTTPMTGGADGAITTKDLQAALRMFDGRRYAVGFEAIDARIRFGMREAGDAAQPADANNLFYYRSRSSLPPADGWTASSYEGWLAVWLDTEANVPPDAPAVTVAGLSSTSSASPSQIATFTPTIVGTFVDDNEQVVQFAIGEADKLKRFQYQVYRHDTGALVYDSNAVTATTDEQDDRAFSRSYPATATTLAAGVVYRVRAKVYDQFDAGSAWSSYRYFQIGAGSMDTETTPTGKQTTQSPSPFAATWRHSGGLSTNAVEIHILDADTGTVLRNSSAIAKTVAANAVSSVTWAQTGFAALDWGTDAKWRMRGRDTAGNWGSWSELRSFSIDAAPTVPSPYTPANNAVRTSRPELAVTVSDPDDSTATLVVKFRIKNSSGTVLFTRTGAYNASTGKFEYQTTSTDIPTFGTWKWDAYAFDGTVYSGGTTVEASAAKSAERTFTYANGPQVTIVAPTDGGTIDTGTPFIDWDVSGSSQVSRRVQYVRDGITIHDNTFATTVTQTTQSATLSTGEVLHEGDEITIIITATDALAISGSDSVTVTVDFPNPPALDLSADLAMAPGDVVPSFVRLSWPQSTYPLSDAGAGAFQYYRLTRQPTADALAADPNLPNEVVRLPYIRTVTTTHYDDHAARPGVEYLYKLRQYILFNGVSLLGSPSNAQTLRVEFDATIITDVTDPSVRIVLAARKERTITPKDDTVVLMPWNQAKPIHLQGETNYIEIDVEYSVVAETPQAASAIMRRAQAMARSRPPLHYRDGRGNSYFGQFAEPPVELDTPGGAPRRLRIRFRELAWDESVTEGDE